MNTLLNKRNIHAKQSQPFPHPLISRHGILKPHWNPPASSAVTLISRNGILKLLFISHNKADKKYQG